MINNKYLTLIAASALFLAFDVNAQVTQTGDGSNILNMFANGLTSFEALIKLVKFSAFTIGLFLIVGSVYKFSQLGSNPQVTPKMPIAMFFCGVGIFALIGSVSVLTTTLSVGANGPGGIFINEGQLSGAVVTARALKAVLTFIQLLGYVAFIRGWLIINDYVQGKGQASIGKGITHLVGGIFAINVSATATILANTFAPGLPNPFS